MKKIVSFKNRTNELKEQGMNFLVGFVLAGMIFLCLTSYGDLHLSVENGDTASYIQGGAAPLFSKDMLTRPGLFTANLLYHLTSAQACKLEVVSYPAIQTETHRGTQYCFDRIAFFQNILAVIGWSVLAWIISKRLSGGYEKLLTAILIPAFGFTGKVMLKTSEAVAKLITDKMREIIKGGSLKTKIGGLLVKPALGAIKKLLDPGEQGAAPLLGLNGLVFIGHGRSDAFAMKNAIRVAKHIELDAGDSPVPALKLKQLKEFMRQSGKNRALSNEQIKALTEILDE